jgi:hypothetical protein
VANIISHPLDTIKVRMQLTKGEQIKLIPTIREIYRYEGVRDFIIMITIASRLL